MISMIPVLFLGFLGCTPADDGFGEGGSATDPADCTPSCDQDDTSAPDDGDTGGTDTGDTADTADTGAGGDSADTSAGSEDPVPTGYDVGDVIYDLAGTTHLGADWTLWSGQGKVQVLVIGHIWDDNLAYVADALGGLRDTYSDLDTTVVVEQALDATVADQDDAADYADSLALERVVWGADTAAFASTTPHTWVIGKDLIVELSSVGIVYEADLSAAIESAQ